MNAPNTEDEWILYHYNRGLLLREVAVIYNLTAEKVERRLKRMGVEEIRPQISKSEQKKIKEGKKAYYGTQIPFVLTIADRSARAAIRKKVGGRFGK